jgi:hypothetical protein
MDGLLEMNVLCEWTRSGKRTAVRWLDGGLIDDHRLGRQYAGSNRNEQRRSRRDRVACRESLFERIVQRRVGNRPAFHFSDLIALASLVRAGVAVGVAVGAGVAAKPLAATLDGLVPGGTTGTVGTGAGLVAHRYSPSYKLIAGRGCTRPMQV